MVKQGNSPIKGEKIKDMAKRIPLTAIIITILLVGTTTAGVITVWAADFIGTPGPENIDGTADDDFIRGLGGNDTLNGNDGEDFISGGSGADEIDGIQGDRGRDFIELSGAGPICDIVPGGADVVFGGSGNDRIEDSSDNEDSCDNIIFADDGNDFVRAGFFGGDIIYGGRGNDEIHGQETAITAYGEEMIAYLQLRVLVAYLLEAQEMTKLGLQ